MYFCLKGGIIINAYSGHEAKSLMKGYLFSFLRDGAIQTNKQKTLHKKISKMLTFDTDDISA